MQCITNKRQPAMVAGEEHSLYKKKDAKSTLTYRVVPESEWSS